MLSNKFLIYILFFIIISGYKVNASAQKIVFWGNSLTYYNNLPNNFGKICTDNKKSPELYFFTKPGVSINYWHKYFLKNPEDLPNKIDFLILQNNSLTTDSFEFALRKVVDLYDSTKVREIILFENYSTVTFSNKARIEDLNRTKTAFLQFREIDPRIKILPIGQIFDGMEGEQFFSYDGHPTVIGSLIYQISLFYLIYNEFPEHLSNELALNTYFDLIKGTIHDTNTYKK